MSERADLLLRALRVLRGEHDVDHDDGRPFTRRDAHRAVATVAAAVARAKLVATFGRALRDDVADDVTQHALEVCLLGRATATTPAGAVDFVGTVAVNKYRDVLRAERRHRGDDAAVAGLPAAAALEASAEARHSLARIQSLRDTIEAVAGRKLRRVRVFFDHRLPSSAAAAPARVNESGRLAAGRVYQDRCSGRRYVRDIAAGLDLDDDDRVLLEKLLGAPLHDEDEHEDAARSDDHGGRGSSDAPAAARPAEDDHDER